MADDTLSHADAPPRSKPDAGGRRAYTRPKLIEYGSLAKLTQGTRTKQSDSPAAGFRKT